MSFLVARVLYINRSCLLCNLEYREYREYLESNVAQCQYFFIIMLRCGEFMEFA